MSTTRIIRGIGGLLAMIGTACAAGPETDDQIQEAASHEAVTADPVPAIEVDPRDFPPATAKNIYALVPGRYDETLSLPDVIRMMDETRDRQSLARQFAEMVAAATGVRLKLPDLSDALDFPEKLTDMFQFDLSALDRARQALLAGDLRPDLPAQHDYQLPTTFDFADLASTDYPLPSTELSPVAPGVYRGYPRNPDRSDEALRRDLILAEVLERLAVNGLVPSDQVLTVRYQDESFEDLGRFIEALQADGHQIEATVEHNVADFAGLHAQGPDGQIHEVAAPAFARTGIFDSEGQEAVVPMFHSEIVFVIHPTAETRGPGVEGAVQFYQGVGRIGFYGRDTSVRQRWTGHGISDRFEGEQSARALILAGLLVDVVRTVAQEKGLPVDGYATTGVCNDSVAIVQQAVRGHTTSYPLMMMDELLLPELEHRMTGADATANADALALHVAVLQVPSNASVRESARRRALRSLPWEPGNDPFFSTEEARRILGEVD